MALHCFVRNIPKYAQLTGKYFSGNSLARSASILSNSKFCYRRMEHLESSCNTTVKMSPTILNKTVDLTQVKAFSVTSSKLSAAAHDHTKMWSAERILSATLLGIAPAAFLFPSQAMDTLLAITFVMHNHWGIEAVVIDYAKYVFGSAVAKIALGLTYALSVGTLVGLLYLIFNGAGLVNTIQILWKI